MERDRDREMVVSSGVVQKYPHLGPMSGTADKQHTSLCVVQIVLEGPAHTLFMRDEGVGPHLPPRDGTAEVRLVSKVLVCEVVLTAHEDPTGSIATSWNCSRKREMDSGTPPIRAH